MRGLLLGLLCSLLVACGARVVVDDAFVGGGGSDGAGAGPGSGAGSGAAAELCGAYCDQRANEGCAPTAGPCEKWCPADFEFMGTCRDEYSAYLECFLTNGFDGAPACFTSMDCSGALDALLKCQYPAGPCTLHDCADTVKDPYPCDHFCGGRIYSSRCAMESPPTCTCMFDGKTIGTCEDIDLQGTCCVQYYALWK